MRLEQKFETTIGPAPVLQLVLDELSGISFRKNFVRKFSLERRWSIDSFRYRCLVTLVVNLPLLGVSDYIFILVSQELTC